jgi:hypothetical protein
MSTTLARTSPLARTARLAGTFGLAGVGACVLLMLIPATSKAIFPAYLVGFAFWFGLGLAGLMLSMLHHLSGGVWGLLARRPLEAAAATLIPMGALFLPIFLGMGVLYPWTNPSDPFAAVIATKAAFLNVPGFVIRSLGYLAFFAVMAVVVNLGSLRQDRDRTADRAVSKRLAVFSGPALAVTFLVASFAAIDWFMSIEPEWYSSIYPAMLMVGWGLCMWGVVVITTHRLRHEPALADVARPRIFHDLGNLMLAFTMLWAYTSFMQFLIIWAGNLTEEIPWYLRRTRGPWQLFVAVLMLFHFFAPFFLLLMRDLKRRSASLAGIAVLILAVHLIDLMWLILPARVREPVTTAGFNPDAAQIPWLSVLFVLLTTAALGAVWVATYLTVLSRKPLVPPNDPAHDRLPGVLHAEAFLEEIEADTATAPAHAGA